MTKLPLLLFTAILCSSCAVATLATTAVKTTATIVTLPIKAIGAAVEAITPDSHDEEGEGVVDED
jgi:hypothetical protein|tara:strand:- start:1010 stop:1204 length:195 start_codon:yes stop_codon:yes gene_type:complete